MAGDELLTKTGKKQFIEKDNSEPVIEAQQYTKEQLDEFRKKVTINKRKANVEQLKKAIIDFYNFFHIVKKDEWIKILDEVKVKDRNYVDSVKQDLETVNGDITIDELKENVLRGTDKRTKNFYYQF